MLRAGQLDIWMMDYRTFTSLLAVGVWGISRSCINTTTRARTAGPLWEFNVVSSFKIKPHKWNPVLTPLPILEDGKDFHTRTSTLNTVEKVWIVRAWWVYNDWLLFRTVEARHKICYANSSQKCNIADYFFTITILPPTFRIIHLKESCFLPGQQ